VSEGDRVIKTRQEMGRERSGVVSEKGERKKKNKGAEGENSEGKEKEDFWIVCGHFSVPCEFISPITSFYLQILVCLID
jgi:hypothetical protein